MQLNLVLQLLDIFSDPCRPIVKGPHVESVWYSRNKEGQTYPTGTTVNIECDANSQLQGVLNSVTCRRGSWGSAIPICVSNSKYTYLACYSLYNFLLEVTSKHILHKRHVTQLHRSYSQASKKDVIVHVHIQL